MTNFKPLDMTSEEIKSLYLDYRDEGKSILFNFYTKSRQEVIEEAKVKAKDLGHPFAYVENYPEICHLRYEYKINYKFFTSCNEFDMNGFERVLID